MSEKSLTWRILAYVACGLVLILATAIWGHLYASQVKTEERVRILESREEANTVRWEFVRKTLEEMSDDLKKHVTRSDDRKP